MQINAAVQWVLVGVESHEVSSFLNDLNFYCQHTTVVCCGGGLIHYQCAARDSLTARVSHAAFGFVVGQT
jgi:hypothetical protein